MRIGVFGGTFDPVHVGHLLIAEQCREQARLDEVWFVPAASPPNKLASPVTPFDRRVEMVALAVAGQPLFRVDTLEKERPGPSFTADTLAELHARHPEHEWFLILGSDSLADLPNWRDPGRIVSLCTLVVAERPGWRTDSEERLRADLRLTPEEPLRLVRVAVPQADFASRDIRRRIGEGRSVRYMVPSAVAAYIADKGLYRGT